MSACYDANTDAASGNATALDVLLRSQPALWRGRDRYNSHAAIATGYPLLDEALPSQGWSIGCLTELLCTQSGIGELSLLLPALRQLTQDDQWVALVRPPYLPYAPALSNAGIDPHHLLIIDVDTDSDALWAAEQLLRCGVFAAVIGWIAQAAPRQLRRLQLAAETGDAWALVYRPPSAADSSSPAAFRLQLSPSSHGLGVHILKSRGAAGRSLCIPAQAFDRSQGIAAWPGMAATVSAETHRDTHAPATCTLHGQAG